MNKARREVLARLARELANVIEDLTDCQNDEQGAFDGMPEPLQGGERGQAMEEGIQSMQEVAESLQEAVNILEALA
jgi:hypothetical protein